MMLQEAVRCRNALLFTVCCFTCVFASPANSSDIQLHVCYEETEIFPNFLGTGAKVASPQPGLIVELLQIIDQQLVDMTIVFHRAAWNRCLKKLEKGEFDAVVAGFEQERAQYAKYPTKDGLPDEALAISIADFCLFSSTHSDMSWNGSRFVATASSTLAIPRGYSLVELLDRLDVAYELTFSSQLSMDLLIGGRVDNAITLCSTGKDILVKRQAESLVKDVQIIRNQYGYVLVSKGFYQRNPSLVERLWQASARVREANYADLLEKYNRLTLTH